MTRLRTTLARTAALVAAAGLVVSTAGQAPAAAPAAPAPAVTTAPSTDILDQVKQLTGVTSVTEATAPAGYRFFKITFEQLADHRRPRAGTFEQRLTLLHKDVARPMVMYTSGYNVSQNPSRSEPTQIVDGNQLSMEYRFFEPSRPANPDWEQQLTIWQAATDQHRIIHAFQKLYRENWITTGGSKGGMTATYHRRFYPSDVNGTIPYVAPNDVDNRDDSAYDEFLDNVGNDPACRARLVGLQKRVLTDRQWYLDKARGIAEAEGYTFDTVGGLEIAVELSVIDSYFVFWQYSRQQDCAMLPDPATATNDDVWAFYEGTASLVGNADQSFAGFIPYYFQASYELGAPLPYEGPLADVLQYPGLNVAETFVPAELKPRRFSKRAMPDIDRWVRNSSTRMLYVYGANDPWSSEPFSCGRTGAKRECARYWVAGGNHGSRIAQLPEAERIRATALILKWAGLGDGDRAVEQIDDAGRPKRNPSLDTQPDYLKHRML
ncbi:S28 family serine protease [Nocardioides speluncae]|uniref:S28 family serine protease n=1 Tax=Nocardioides speluncae TaxID=2670337 RepID=UPI000D69B1BC|nr:S28 family serine protease [Nocardioides speluncae]